MFKKVNTASLQNENQVSVTHSRHGGGCSCWRLSGLNQTGDREGHVVAHVLQVLSDVPLQRCFAAFTIHLVACF